MQGTLSVVIAARNCADRLEGTILPWKAIASEIIVADQMSSDQTPDVANKLGCRLIRNDPPGGNFDLNRKIAMEQALGDWILYIDTDERPTPELLSEIREFLTKTPLEGSDAPCGARIPNVFYFLGKPLRHGIFNPRSAEIRMVRRGRWQYPCEDGFHRGVSVDGAVVRFENPYKHFNVNSISEWFIKTNQYTEHDAEKSAKDGKAVGPTYGAFFEAWRFFIKHYVFRLGFLDGFHGLVSVFYFMLYHLTLRVKKWEKLNERTLMEERDWLRPLEIPRR